MPAGGCWSQQKERVVGAQRVLGPGIYPLLLQYSRPNFVMAFKLMDLKAL
jgi:hypothetical protein